jgi:hypothetical protein
MRSSGRHRRIVTDLKVEVVDIEKLKFDSENARRHPSGNLLAIANSLQRFGQRRPLIVRGSTVIAGNGTLQAAQSLGWKTIAVTEVPADWTDDEVRAYAIADNRTAELAEWDSFALLDALTELDKDLLAATGFDETNIEALSKVFGDAPDLDDLLDEYGEPTDDDGMVRVSFSVPADVAARWEMAVKSAGSGSVLENTCTAVQSAYDALVDNE